MCFFYIYLIGVKLNLHARIVQAVVCFPFSRHHYITRCTYCNAHPCESWVGDEFGPSLVGSNVSLENAFAAPTARGNWRFF